MNSLTQTPALQADAANSQLVTPTYAAAQAAFSPTANGVWERTLDGQGRVVLRLRIADQGAEASADFAPEELANPAHLAKRLASLQSAVVRVGHWRGRLETLFAQIRAWAATLPGGAAVVTEAPRTVREERSGEYTVSELLLHRGGAEMRVVPIAAWVVGANGRVDLLGAGGPFVLIHDETDGWQYVRERYPVVTLEVLTEGLFHQLAQACLDA